LSNHLVNSFVVLKSMTIMIIYTLCIQVDKTLAISSKKSTLANLDTPNLALIFV
jgi:hypothetical protein